VTQLRDLGFADSVEQAGERLVRRLLQEIENA
jgi:hypothetical protein